MADSIQKGRVVNENDSIAILYYLAKCKTVYLTRFSFYYLYINIQFVEKSRYYDLFL